MSVVEQQVLTPQHLKSLLEHVLRFTYKTKDGGKEVVLLPRLLFNVQTVLLAILWSLA